MTWGIFKHDSIAEAVAKVQSEALKGDQHKLDKNKNGKLDKEDFKKLRKEENEESVSEGWDDMLKYVKDKNGPQPNGGSGKKQGTRYGGGKQKEDEAEKRKEKNESVEQIDELSKTTLNNYVDAAKQDNKDHADSRRSGDADEAKWAKDRMVKRSTGMGAAKQRLNKEEVELDELIAEVLSADQDAGKWISDFVKSDNPKFAGKSPEKRKQMALAAYYAAQKKESTNYDEFIELDEEVQKDIVKMGAKEIKHANVKDKLNDQEVMEPHSKGEADFLDQHSIEVTDDPARDGHKTGADKLSHASEPRGKGAGKYDGKNKTGVKESASEEGSSEEIIDEACGSSKAKGKKTYSSFKKEMNKG